MRWVAVLLTSLGLLAGPTSATAARHLCPPAPEWPSHNPWRAAEKQVAPQHPVDIRLCRYSTSGQIRRSRLLRNRQLIRQLVGDFDHLTVPPSTGRSGSTCAGSNHGFVLARLFYRSHRVDIGMYLGGCDVSNGDLDARSDAELKEDVQRLTQS